MHIPNVTDLTITRKKSRETVYRIPFDVFVKSIEVLDQLKHLKCLRLELLHRKEYGTISAIQGHLPHLQQLYLISCSFEITETQILAYIIVAEKLTVLSFSDSKVICSDINGFYSKVLAIVMKRPTKAPLTIYGWTDMEKPKITSNWLKIFQI